MKKYFYNIGISVLFLTFPSLAKSSQVNCVFSYAYGIHVVEVQTIVVSNLETTLDLSFENLRHIGALATIRGPISNLIYEIEETSSGIRASSEGELSHGKVSLYRDGHHQRFHLQCF